MTRTLILIPVMYSREELKKILGLVPDDFEEASSEFWSYAEAKLNAFVGKVYAIYSEKPNVTKEGDSRVDAIIGKLIESHAEFHAVEDPLLVAEAEAWLELMKNGQNQAALDLFRENMKERDEYAGGVIERTLREGEIGVLLTDPARKIPFPDDIKVIRMCPFDPLDYVNRHLAKLKIEKKRE